jgi:hypothetical protein
VHITNSDGNSDIRDTDDLVAHVTGGNSDPSAYSYRWYRNGIRLEDAAGNTLSNQQMKTFVGNPGEYTPASSHSDHAIQGYVFLVAVFDGDIRPGADSITVGGPTVSVDMRGVNFTAWELWNTTSGKAEASLQALVRRINPNWVSVWTFYFQTNWDSPTIFARDTGLPITIPDAETINQINAAHDLGLNVILYPQIWLAGPDGQGTPWGRVDLTASEAWFASYREFIIHQADIADETGVELFVIGVELESTVQYTDQWYSIIGEVREHYDGSITYSPIVCCEGQAEQLTSIPWLWELDYLGLSANLEYPPDNFDPTLSELVAYYEQRASAFEAVAAYFDKPAVFLETSTIAANGATLGPHRWDENTADFQEQADYYDAFLRVFGNKPWVRGIFWNQWLSSMETWYLDDPNYPTGRNVEFVGRPAERVLASWYGADS